MTDFDSTDALLCDDDNEIEDYNLDQDEEAELLREDEEEEDDEAVLTCQVDPLEEEDDEDCQRDKFASERSNDLKQQTQEKVQTFVKRVNKLDYNQSNHNVRVNKKPLLSLHGVRGRGRGGNYQNKTNRIAPGKCYVHPSLLKGKKPVQSVQPWLNQINSQPFEPERRVVSVVNTFQQPRFQQPMQYPMHMNNFPEQNIPPYGPPAPNHNNNWQQPNNPQQMPMHQQNYYDGPAPQQPCYPPAPNQFNPPQQPPLQYQPPNANNYYQNPTFQNQNSNFVQPYPQQQNPPTFQNQQSFGQQCNFQPSVFQPPHQNSSSIAPPQQYHEPPFNNRGAAFIPSPHHPPQGPSPPQRFPNQNHPIQANNRFSPAQQKQPPMQQQQHQSGNWNSASHGYQNGGGSFRGRGRHSRGFHQNRFNQPGRVHRQMFNNYEGEQGANNFKRRNDNWNQAQQGHDDYPKRRICNINYEAEELEEQGQQEEQVETEQESQYENSAANQVTNEDPTPEIEEDEETKAYRKKIEEQKRKREEILAEKERKRLLAIMKKKGQVSDIHALEPSQPSSTPARKAPSQRVVANNSNLRILTHLDNSANTKLIAPSKSIQNSAPSIEKPNSSKNFFANRKVISNDNSMMDTSIVIVRNLAASSTDMQLRKLCQGVGHVQSLEMSSKERLAKIRFNSVASAHAFYKKYQRHMLDLSMIQVELVPDSNQIGM